MYILVLLLILDGEPIHYTNELNNRYLPLDVCLENAQWLRDHYESRGDITVIHIGCEPVSEPDGTQT
jgi:hypothetical protein